LRSTGDLKGENSGVYSEFTLERGHTADFIRELYDQREAADEDLSLIVTRVLQATMEFWKQWVAMSEYNGRWREIVNRSALVLKLLISYKYGSMVVAPTFSLPEHIGGERNWDYRYTWIRDASFTIYSLMHLGYVKEAENFMLWVENLCQNLGEGGNLKL